MAEIKLIKVAAGQAQNHDSTNDSIRVKSLGIGTTSPTNGLALATSTPTAGGQVGMDANGRLLTYVGGQSQAVAVTTDGGAYTVLTSSFTQPAVNSNVQIAVTNALWMVAGEIVYVATGGYYSVVSVDSGTLATIKNLGYTGNLAPTQTVPNSGGVTPGGLVGPTGATGTSTGVGTYASRPAAGNTGAQYFSTDGTRNFVDDGSNWRPDINGCLGTQPGVVSGWTWVNQSTATATDVGGAIFLKRASNATDSVSILTKTLSPSSGYTLLAHIRPTLYPISFTQAGIILRNSGDGKHVGFLMLSHTTSGVHLTINKFNSTTSFNSNYVDLVAALVGDGIWLRIVDDTTNRISSFSFDGKNFVQLHSVSRTDFLTPDTYGVGVNPLNGEAACTLDSVSQA